MKRAAGIDVSIWQDDNSTPQMVDFGKSRQAGASFAFIKASQGNWLDQDMVLNWSHARSAGIPRGAYHFMDWTVNAAEQARFFCGLLKGDLGELPPVLDFECRTGAPGRSRASAAARIFLEEVEYVLGITPILYTSPSYWSEFGVNDAFFARFPLWIANYYVSAPKLPAPWTDWLFWQWGTGKGLGPLYGAESKDLDQNWYNGDLAAFQARYGLPVGPVEPPVARPLPALTHRTTVAAQTVRSGPGTQFAPVGMLTHDQQVEIYAIAGANAWGQIDPVADTWACIELNGRRYLIQAEEA